MLVKNLLNYTSDVMELDVRDHFPGLVYFSNHDVSATSHIITVKFTTTLCILLL